MNTFTVFLLTDVIPDPAAALDGDKRVTAIPLTAELGLPGVLFVGRQQRATPQWVGMMNPFLERPIGLAYNASISAVLIVQYQDRWFAVPFGYGRTLLTPNAWVRDFGLKVTLNRVNPAKLRSIDSKIYDDMVVSTRKQTSQSSRIDNFELDISRALIRGITGDTHQGDVFKRLTGAAPVQAATDLGFAQLPQILEELLDAYEDDSYQDSFPWVDNVREADPLVKVDLDQRLTNALAADNLHGVYLAAPEIVNWENIRRFSYTNGGTIAYLELSFSEYAALQEEHNIAITTDVLKRHRVRVQYEGDDAFYDRWSVYECLVYETVVGNHRFVLMDGVWFEIASDFNTRVTDFVTSISSQSIQFPDAAAGEGEGAYNEAVAAGEPDVYAMLDRETFYPSAAASPIEFCDLLSVAGHLVHVKKRTSSGTLSHLFSQGSVSCDLFLQDSQLRAMIRQRLTDLGKPAHAALIPQGPPVRADYEVVYAVIARAGQVGWPPPLPFFSSLNLMHHARLIQNLGFDVSLQYIRMA